MKFVLEVDVDDAATPEDFARELERVLRYWAGNLRHYTLEPGTGEAVYDSGHRQVGSWRCTEA
ncbi:hypothetical protein [Streptomyces sp. NPDC017941]|uniref:hypothetical protein n=1 Tax=Streptomyces sp. NPDC017941 TaxID=3365018 RepID=UPI00379A76C0